MHQADMSRFGIHMQSKIVYKDSYIAAIAVRVNTYKARHMQNLPMTCVQVLRLLSSPTPPPPGGAATQLTLANPKPNPPTLKATLTYSYTDPKPTLNQPVKATHQTQNTLHQPETDRKPTQENNMTPLEVLAVQLMDPNILSVRASLASSPEARE